MGLLALTQPSRAAALGSCKDSRVAEAGEALGREVQAGFCPGMEHP